MNFLTNIKKLKLHVMGCREDYLACPKGNKLFYWIQGIGTDSPFTMYIHGGIVIIISAI
jgi:hypothetical protein